MSKQPRILMRVDRGALVPADKFALAALRDRGLKIGDIIAVEFSKPRNPGFWRLAHAFGTMCADNIEKFAGMDCHRVLKVIQHEAGIECDETDIDIPGFGVLKARKPRSLAFESMDQTRFYEVLRSMCRWVSVNHWKTMTEDQILEMAEIMVGD